ncbi:MAG TPA: archease [Phycisphaerales bacterium]|nr:archease [Phycisphaerales bacterium]
MSGKWQHFNHQADIGVRGTGLSVEEAFTQAAIALTAVICSPDTIEQTEQIDIHCCGNDLELLFVDFLNAIIYEMAIQRMLFGRFKVTIDKDDLYAKAWGEKADPEKHQTAVEVKGATYTELHVVQDTDGQWSAQCVVDV